MRAISDSERACSGERPADRVLGPSLHVTSLDRSPARLEQVRANWQQAFCIIDCAQALHAMHGFDIQYRLLNGL